VREAVVVAREDEIGEKRLVAYIVAQGAETAGVSELRSYLKERLPEYMLPNVYLLLEQLPLTPNGKVDHKALPAPGDARPELEEEYVAPRTAVEEIVAGIWSEVLKVERVGISDNFFELGGHSLLATQVISRLREAFHLELPLRSLFEQPTVSHLSTVITQSRSEQKESFSDVIKKADQESDHYLLTKLDQLSEKDMDSLLSNLLARTELDE
jgi:acyl carrier protein